MSHVRIVLGTIALLSASSAAQASPASERDARAALVRAVAQRSGGLPTLHAMLRAVLPETKLVPLSTVPVDTMVTHGHNFTHIELGDNARKQNTTWPGDDPYRSVWPRLNRTRFNVSLDPQYVADARIARASLDGSTLTVVMHRSGTAKRYETGGTAYQKIVLHLGPDFLIKRFSVANGRTPFESMWKTLDGAKPSS